MSMVKWAILATIFGGPRAPAEPCVLQVCRSQKKGGVKKEPSHRILILLCLPSHSTMRIRATLRRACKAADLQWHAFGPFGDPPKNGVFGVPCSTPNNFADTRLPQPRTCRKLQVDQTWFVGWQRGENRFVRNGGDNGCCKDCTVLRKSIHTMVTHKYSYAPPKASYAPQ